MKNLTLFLLPLTAFFTIITVLNAGLTSDYVRQALPSIEMPLETFPSPSGYNAPEQVHITQGDRDGRAMIISWVTPLDLPGSNVVTYWIAPNTTAGNSSTGNSSAGNSSDLKMAKKKAQGSTSSYRYYDYASGYFHHANIKGLEYNTTYIYEVGKATVRRFNFTTPPPVGPDVPYTFGIMGDLGQTYASNETLYHYMSNPKGQAVLFAGDLSYADDHTNHDQIKWDSFGKFMEPCAAFQPFIYAAGNHELDFAPEIGEPHPFKPYMHRYPNAYQASGSISPLWYSVRRGPAHIIILSSYSAYGKYTPQYLWLDNELKHNVNRKETPWLIVIVHSPWYNSNNYHYMEGESMRVTFESWLVNSKVDLVLSGHVHAYERSERISNIQYNITNGLSTPIKDPNAPIYITIGDGGNIEGIANSFTDPQPMYSAYREASFGHAVLDIKNRTHAEYTWHKNQENEPVASDSFIIRNRFTLLDDERI